MTVISPETSNSESFKEGKFEKITELVNRIYVENNGRKEVLGSKFSQAALWKDFDLWVSLFERLLEMGLRNEQSKTGPNRLFNLIAGNVQKAFMGKDNGEVPDGEVNSSAQSQGSNARNYRYLPEKHESGYRSGN